MTGIESILRAANFARQFESQLGPAFAIGKMVQEQAAWRNQLGVLSLRNAVFKGVGMTDWVFNPLSHQLIAESLTKVTENLLPRFAIPSTLLSSLDSINHNYFKAFQSLGSIANVASYHLHPAAQLSSVRFALNGLTKQMATIAAAQRQWSLFDDLNIFSKHVSEFVETLESERSWTDGVKEKWLLVVEYSKKVYDKNKKVGRKAILILSILTIPTDVHQYVDFLRPKPELVTKENLQSFRQETIEDVRTIVADEISKYFSNVLNEEKRVTMRPCKIRLKPSSGSYVVATVSEGFDVVVIQNNHEWSYVSYFDPKDNLPQSGWILKKYLGECL